MANIEFQYPEAILSDDWLARHLGDANLRIFDCSTQLVPDETGERPYLVKSRREDHDAGHIPGAGIFDLQADFSVTDSPFGMTLAEPEHVAAAFARHGIGEGTRVVLYSRGSISWATRFWWMLRWLGFDNAAVLDGGYDNWVAQGRPVSTEQSDYSAEKFPIALRPGLFVTKREVLDAIDDPRTATVNALGSDVFSGENLRYGRPGRIAGSVSVPKTSLVDPETMKFLPADEVARRFTEAGVDQAEKHITYCGGGIFATVDAFLLHQLGHKNIAVYDNSMSEWGPDENLPMESG